MKKEFLLKKVVEARYMTETEKKELGWYSRAVVLVLDDGVKLFPSMDCEGNGAGSLFTADEKNPVLPVLGNSCDEKLTKRWIDIAKKQFEGAVITGVRYLNENELDNLEWYSPSVVFFFNNENYFFVSADDEGNDSGCLFTSNEKFPSI